MFQQRHEDSTKMVDGDEFALTTNVIDTKAMRKDSAYEEKDQVKVKGKLTNVFKKKVT